MLRVAFMSIEKRLMSWHAARLSTVQLKPGDAERVLPFSLLSVGVFWAQFSSGLRKMDGAFSMTCDTFTDIMQRGPGDGGRVLVVSLLSAGVF